MNPTHDIAASNPIWENALGRMKARIDETMRSSLPGFPHYADPTTGQWVTSADGFWTGGFWIGELWLAGRYWNEPAYFHAAEEGLRKARAQNTFEIGISRISVLLWRGARRTAGEQHAPRTKSP